MRSGRLHGGRLLPRHGREVLVDFHPFPSIVSAGSTIRSLPCSRYPHHAMPYRNSFRFLSDVCQREAGLDAGEDASPHKGRAINAMEVKEYSMANGTVKWFNPTKGFGFIQPDQGGADVFVHISAVERAGIAFLNEGQRISYELATNKGKTSAANLKLLDAA
jgi:CspA family cold shock protein